MYLFQPKSKPLLTAVQKKNRLKWAKERSEWTQRQWDSIIWSDESRFELCVSNLKNKVIRRPGEEFLSECIRRSVKFPVSVMVWGCMSAQGVGALHIVDGTVNADKYIGILENHLLPTIRDVERRNVEYIFQQDGAPCHTAKKTKAWMEENEVNLMEWPSSSPDLSPIETLWGVIKKKLKQNPPKTKTQLIEHIRAIWSSFDEIFCKSLVSTMNKRIQYVIKNKGDVTPF